MSDLPSWARVGAKVVCIHGAPHGRFGGAAPQTDGIYTIREAFWAEGYGAFLRLVEITGERVAWNGGCEGGWDLHRFRPLITQEDDLEAYFNVYLKTDHRATRRVGEDA